MSIPETYQENAFSAERTRVKRLQRAAVILDERDHQDKKWGIHDHSLDEWMTILNKWQGKLADEIIRKWERPSEEGWRRRAIQVAAIALAMVEQTTETRPEVLDYDF